MKDFLERSRQLLGNEKVDSFKEKTILVAGVGGVGGTALECLARSGFNKFLLVDFDVVDVTNLNRQILFTSKDVGKSKVECAKKHIEEIDSSIDITIINCKIGESNLAQLDFSKVDFIVDAIDDINGKFELYKFSLENNIPLISSLGMGNRVDPEQVTLTTLAKTENDPLARKIRYEAKQRGIDTKKIHVVFSKELPLIKSPKPASMMMVPSTAGLLIAKYIIETIK